MSSNFFICDTASVGFAPIMRAPCAVIRLENLLPTGLYKHVKGDKCTKQNTGIQKQQTRNVCCGADSKREFINKM